MTAAYRPGIFAPAPEPVEVHPDTLELVAWHTGDTIERDPATGRLTLRTSHGVYVAQGGAA